ncbi:MAG: aminotransferase class III-fold pyridoxal phosphate-dependent enzyme [Acidobacteria bacterium]|nr:aminotransferase class III-fold pyridoxal phosphate-dependent enzyme [Acidobacteriota bacterium]MCW5968293.1 aminotransferase class III-fold pyridoxal phosphate-dependent enzyme [Blastocatellales bacterium]
MNTRQAEELARTLYGVDASARALAGEMDHNFHLTTPAGEQFVLKVMHGERDRALVEMQCAALSHLASADSQISLPRVHRTVEGAEITAVRDAQDAERLVWMLDYLPGRLLADLASRPDSLLHDLGASLGRIDASLADFDHPFTNREMRWDAARAHWVRDCMHLHADPARRTLIEHFLAPYESDVLPVLENLRRSVIHNDANDYNIVISAAHYCAPRVSGVIDFGDLLYTNTVAEPAIAAAYALLDQPDPLRSAASLVAGYNSAYKLSESEIAVLYHLIAMRLAISVTISAERKPTQPGNEYLTVSEDPAWRALQKWAEVHPRFAHYAFRAACELEPAPQNNRMVSWLGARTSQFAPVINQDLKTAPSVVLDLSVGSLLLGADPAATETEKLTQTIFNEMKRARADVGVGRYDEARALYLTPAFAPGAHATDERRTVHLGIDLFVEAGAPVFAPLEGEVHCAADNDAPLDYGPLVILRHAPEPGIEFFTLYGHLGEDALNLEPGRRIAAGERIASIGAPPRNGDWPPHLHLQIILDLLDLDRDFPGVAFAGTREIWKSLSPDPNLLLGIPPDRFPPKEPAKDQTLAARRSLLGRNLSVSYSKPLKIVRGWRQYLYDETGRAYLDAYNNVPLVGHSHPRVVGAVQRQMALLNTNTRYLHDTIIRYAEALRARMPRDLRVCYFLNSASEANELALRLARTHTGGEDLIVLEAAYHGHTTTLIDASPYKFNGPGGRGPTPRVHVALLPDDYRGPYKRGDGEAGRKYADHVAGIVNELNGRGARACAFLAETLPSVGGQIVFPPGYLKAVYEKVRASGGVCIADEVQTGFGRLGRWFWGFEMQGVEPDIVVLGKPIGNGFPLAAVVTTEPIAASFDNGMEFFSTFGGNPVACAAGLAVLEALEEECLQQQALRVGDRLIDGLRGLMSRYELIGDVRGAGLFLGVELVRDRETLEPAAEEASHLVNRLREEGLLAGTDGPLHNVIKLRPPLVITEDDADRIVSVFDRILMEG